MAICVQLQPDGTLVPTGEAVSECTAYVLASGSEFGVYEAVNTALTTPTSDVVSSWFFGAWGAVMVAFIAGRCVGAVLSMFEGR